MLCPNCRSSVSEGSNCCIYCGKVLPDSSSTDNRNNYLQTSDENYFTRKYSMDYYKGPKKRNNRLFLIISLVVAGFILLSVPPMYMLYENVYVYNKQVSSVIGEIERKDFKKARSSYDKLKNQPGIRGKKAVSTIDKKLEKKAEEISNDYIKLVLPYNELEEWFEGLKEFTFLKNKIAEKEKSLKKYKDSRDSMGFANDLMKNNQYLDAIEDYKKVIKEDQFNYSEAQKKIRECISDMYRYYLDQADKMDSDGNYEYAYKTAQSLKEYYPDDEALNSKMEFYLNNLLKATIEEADKYNSGKQFDKAIGVIENVKVYFPDEKKLDDKLNSYKKNKIAAELEEKARKEKRKKELIAQTTKKYDSKNSMDIYAPKGFSPSMANIDEKFNIEPKLFVSGGNYADMMVIVGFIQKDYINFNTVSFDVDGEVIEWEVPQELKRKQYAYGTSAEWCLILNTFNLHLVKDLEKISNGKDVKMVFTGDKVRNHVLTKKEKDILKLFLELYGYFDHMENSFPDNSSSFDTDRNNIM
jgi:hypothetical protein